jgi:hypothetical protein
MDGILYSDTSASAPIECSSTSSSAPSCEVVISGLTSGYEAHITIDVVNTDFGSSNEYISSVMAGSHSLGSRFLESGGEDDNCGKKTRILDAVQVPGSAITGEQMTVRISTSSSVGGIRCSGKTLDAEVTFQQTVPATTCTDCEAGKYGPGMSSTNCTDCAAGKYTAIGSSTVCTDCPAGKYSRGVLSVSSSLCKREREREGVCVCVCACTHICKTERGACVRACVCTHAFKREREQKDYVHICVRERKRV